MTYVKLMWKNGFKYWLEIITYSLICVPWVHKAQNGWKTAQSYPNMIHSEICWCKIQDVSTSISIYESDKHLEIIDTRA